MRDINRIDKFCQRLAEAWKNVPDWRFGQIIENLKRAMGKEDIFYIEDNEMIDYIENYFKDY